MNVFELIALLFVSVSSVQAIALLPSLQGTDWYSGETVSIQAVQNTDNDGSFYNAYLKSDDLVEQVLFEAPYQQYTSFVVPDAFNGVGSATLYVVAQGNTGKDNLRVVIYNTYDYYQLYPNNCRRCRDNTNYYVRPCSGGGCTF